ncbi:hypothetical protein F4680DRAFT_445948 [Xylaria scruposa]|nr:hypothetical protein F4680DRAFT_445948 [Xylaria scruposa]
MNRKIISIDTSCSGPASVLPGDRPSVIQEGTKPFLCVNKFEALDTYFMSFEEMVDFIHCNGWNFRWPRKSNWQRKLERDAKKEHYLKAKLNRPGDDISNPIVVSPIRSTQPRASAILNAPEKIDSSNSLYPLRLPFNNSDKTCSFSPIPPSKVCNNPNILEPSPHRIRLPPTSVCSGTHNLWDENIEMIEAPLLERLCATSTAESQAPKLSVVCQPGWDLNNKAIWIQASGIKYDNDVVPCRSIRARPLGPVEPSISTVSFNKVPEKDVKAFLSNFLGSGEV